MIEFVDDQLPPLSDKERSVYEWQMWIRDLGETGQRKLKQSSVLVSRVGGVGGAVAYELAAAGVGKLILAHGGILKPSDLNRQLLMTDAWIGKPRIESIRTRLLELNPRLEIETWDVNIDENNAFDIVRNADVVVDCAPLFEERFAMNRQAIVQGKPLVECSMYELEAQIFSVIPHESACLQCVFPKPPPHWKREFPVLGAVSGMVGCLGAIEAIKIITGIGQPLIGRLLQCSLRDMSFRTYSVNRRVDCEVCGRAPDQT